MRGSTRSFGDRLLRWYDRHRRDLPWRASAGAAAGTFPDPYHVLVSEAMLQQTQVVTVVPHFHRFLQRFPTIRVLSNATAQDVLRMWQGLGYYSRARNLHAAARIIVRDFAGRIPSEAQVLRLLPGVGRYTAGAVASLAFDAREPIVDGNVTRVLCRIDRIESDPRQTRMRQLLWQRAEAILPHSRAGDFNSAMMELGATVCTPRSPKCQLCPVRNHCEAFDAGVQDTIPPPRKATATPLVRRRTLCISRVRSGVEQWLIEQRPLAGRWGGMWQFITRSRRRTPTPEKQSSTRLCKLSHGLTHMRYAFDVYILDRRQNGGQRGIEALSIAGRPTRWVTLDALDAYPLPRPHLRIAQLLRDRRRAVR